MATSAPATNIRGRVIDNDSGAPVADAKIQVISAEGLVVEFQSAEDGRFELDSAVMGPIKLVASQNGYVDLFAHQPATIVVSNREHPSPVELRLTRASTISGQVFDPSGLPVRGVKVVAMMRRARSGSLRFIEVGGSVFTDDRGAYRLFDLAPGIYTVGVFPAGEGTVNPTFLPIYFPNVTERLRAGFFTLNPGENRTQADFIVERLSSVKLAGIISGIPPGWSKSTAAVCLFSDDGDPIQTVISNTEGRFTFPGVPIGAYRIVAWGPIFGGGQSGHLALPHGRAASQHIDVGSSEVSDLSLELEDLGTLSGRVSYDRADRCPDRGSDRGTDRTLVLLSPVNALPDAQALTAIVSHDTFSILDVPAGRYRVQLRGLLAGCYPKRVSWENRNAVDGIVSVSGNTRVGVVIGADSATVSGTVKLSEGQSLPTTAQVLLVANEDGNFEGETMFASPNGDGLFRFDLVPPGFYQVIALSKVDALDYLDPVFATDHGALLITAKPGSLTTIEVPLSK